MGSKVAIAESSLGAQEPTLRNSAPLVTLRVFYLLLACEVEPIHTQDVQLYLSEREMEEEKF
jgi:hypothetical protein